MNTLKKVAIAQAMLCMTSGGSPSVFTSRAATTHPPAANSKPNIIMILADDLGYADMSAYPGGRFSTPNIDRIGAQGVTFTDGYATAPVCAPSRAGLITGRYQERFGFEYNDGPAKRSLNEGLGVDLREVTVAQLLKDSGYHTGMVGKWHLGMQKQFYPMNRGFDEFVGFLSGATSYIDPTQPGVHISLGPNVGDEVLEMLQTPMGKDAYGKRRKAPGGRSPLNEIVEGADHHVVHNEQEYLTDYFGDRAVQFIQRNSKADKPYFLYLAFNAPHTPHMVTAKYYDRFSQIKDHQLRVYAAMIAALDEQVGRVLDAVDASGQANNTLIYFASDNGCAAMNPGLCSCTPLRGGKLSHYEGGVRVPFLMRWPGHIKPGTVYRNPVSLMDVLPTSVAAADGKLPRDRVYDGVNLVPYVTGQITTSPHETLVWRREPLVSIRNGDWKLWESMGGDQDRIYGNYKLLFNLKNDLNETANLAEKNPEQVKKLEQMIHQWERPMIQPNFPSKNAVTKDVCGTTFTLPI